MIRETFARLFSGVKAKKNGPGLNADRHFSKEITYCPKCNAPIKKTIWRLPGFQSRTTARMATERYGLGCEIEWKCPCGFTHSGALFEV